MHGLIFIPGIFFLLLFLGELSLPNVSLRYSYHRWDWLLNIIGFFMQGLAVPLCGYLIATQLLPLCLPSMKGLLPLSWWGAFLLNFIGIDFMYYWQHRLFHNIPWLWNWHRCHHASPRVDVWATARNSIFINFFFVYLLVNPIVGFLCKNPSGFFVGATLTASLDLLRHSQINWETIPLLRKIIRWMGLIFVVPPQHHRHHYALLKAANFGANLIVWDKLFKTYCMRKEPLLTYQDPDAISPLAQLLYPFKV